MIYRCRILIPEETIWYEIESDSPELAANEYHTNISPTYSLSLPYTDSDNRRCTVNFALVEVEGYETLISRWYRYGIWRKGGIKPRNFYKDRIKEIAEKLGWNDDPMLLLEPGWNCEESLEEAEARVV